MRTTVTLDPDVAAKLKEETRKRGISFKEALNSSVRRGLERGEAKPGTYRLPPPHRMGARPGVNLDKALQLAGELEDEEILRKMALRK
ncbi:MAG TPA: CopG family transcriptional regulator [Solirubrobacterales bacterium]